MAKERQRNEDARGGDVIVNDSIASGKPDLPIDRDPGRETAVAVDADQLREDARAGERKQGTDSASESDQSSRSHPSREQRRS